MGRVQYTIITVIEESEKGKVYLASAEGYDGPVIVKILKYGNPKIFQTLQEINSDCFPQIYHVEHSEEGLVVIEEYLAGEVLEDLMGNGVLTEEQQLGIAQQLCRALHELHSHIPPIIHRDIKPTNVIVGTDGQVKLIDFDSARLFRVEADGDTRLLGTEKYAAPEQYGFAQTDCRSDIYSLGVVFGHFPKLSSGIRQKRWAKLIDRCTSFAPDSRYQTVDEIGKEIRRIQRRGTSGWWRTGILICTGLLICVMAALWILLQSGSRGAEDSGVAGDRGMTEDTGTAGDGGMTSDAGVTEGEQKADGVTDEPAESETESIDPDAVTGNPEQQSWEEVAPEWRELETDTPEYVALKERIREQHLVVEYCFKDRMEEKDFLLHLRLLDSFGAQLQGIEVSSYITGETDRIPDDVITVEGQIIHLNCDYMESLEEGYYQLNVWIRQANDTLISCGCTLYVADSDPLEEPQRWLQNTTLSFYGQQEETLHVVLKNDYTGKIVSITDKSGKVIDDSLYRITAEGRVMELSYELLSRDGEEEMVFWIVSEDGSRLDIRIRREEQEFLQGIKIQ